MIIRGYKAFHKDKTNRYGKVFEEGKTYSVENPISFGNTGNGYHICTHLSDVFRYFDTAHEEVLVAEVTGRGKFKQYDDEYYGYYDMYSFEEITIERFLSREEIIQMMLHSTEHDIKKFIWTFHLNPEEKITFFETFFHNKTLCDCILYYQFGIDTIYEIPLEERETVVRKVLKYGQNYNKRS